MVRCSKELTNRYCCGTLAYLISDGRIRITNEEGREYYELWTSRDPEDKWEPEVCILFFCPNCGRKL